MDVELLVLFLRRVECYYIFEDFIEVFMDVFEEVERRKLRKRKCEEVEEEIFVVDDFCVDIEKYVNRLYEIVRKFYSEIRELYVFGILFLIYS